MEKTIEDIILTLSPNKQLLFGISCVIRMESFLENYLISTNKRSRFVPISQLTDKVLFNCTLELFNQIETRVSCDDIKLVEQIIPDTDEDGINEAVLAQNAAIALAYCLDFIKENDAKYIGYCAIKLIETADIIALSYKRMSNSDAFVSQELAIQKQLLRMIHHMQSDFDQIELNKLKQKIVQIKVEC
ncbi:MAG: hypothetical protein ACFNVO_09390 [Prevotella sp.]|nr:MAG: hypothetical protein D8H98_16750 [Prevotella sp.]